MIAILVNGLIFRIMAVLRYIQDLLLYTENSFLNGKHNNEIDPIYYEACITA